MPRMSGSDADGTAGAIAGLLQDLAEPVALTRGQLVFRAGDAARHVFHVDAGAVQLVRHGRAGERILLHDARAGEFFAEASLGAARYHCDAVVAEDCVLSRLDAQRLVERLRGDPQAAFAWMTLLARQLRAVRMRAERLSLKTAAERVRHLLLSEGCGDDCAYEASGSLKDLAHALGLTPEALYRSLAALEQAGEIARDGKRLRLARRA